MPKISLVVCVFRERDLLERLLLKAKDCYDDLVVVHDGPENEESPRSGDWSIARDWTDRESSSEMIPHLTTQPLPGSVHELVSNWSGRFYVHPKVGSLEGQSPFAWSRAQHDWVLRLDADEFPSDEMREWLQEFRRQQEPPSGVSGFTCIWPLWDGQQRTTHHWPDGRIFLLHRERVQFFGLVEQVPIPLGSYEPVPVVLHHQPKRKSYGIRNIVFRKQAYRWRQKIATSLQGSPLDLPRWRWKSDQWPANWQVIVDMPVAQAIYRLFKFPVEQFKNLRRAKERFSVSVCLNPALHHFLLCIQVWRAQRYRIPFSMFRRIAKSCILRLTHWWVGGAPKGRMETWGEVCPWTLDVEGLSSSSKMLSGGVGGDISFELRLAQETGCSILLLDPSPTGQETIRRLEPLPASIEYLPLGLSSSSGVQAFSNPLDASEGSFRIPDANDKATHGWECITPGEAIMRKNWSSLDVLKLDIEGFEFDVLSSLLSHNIVCRQLLVEFHYGRDLPHSFGDYMRMLFRLKKAGYKLVHRFKADHTFIKD